MPTCSRERREVDSAVLCRESAARERRPIRRPLLLRRSVVSAIAARAHRTAFAQVLSSIVPRGLSCISGGSTHASPFVSHDRGFFRSRARAPPPTSPPPSSPSPHASLPCDGPILRPRAGLPLSQGPATLSVRDKLRSHTPHASPLILAALCWLLHVCAEALQAPFEQAA